MEKKLLLIEQGISFMANAIEKNLKAEGYEIIKVAPQLPEIEAHRKDANIILFYTGEFVLDIPKTLVYLKDICTEDEKLLILVGNNAELAAVDEIIPPALPVARFARPFDMKKLTEEVNRLVAVEDINAHKRSILLVDDDGTFLKMVKGWLSEHYRVTIVSSGTQALLYLADNKPDLILLDYEMPVTSGPQVLSMIRSEERVASVPVIFLTGKGDRESVMKVLEMKPDGYLLKTLGHDALLKAVHEFFEKKKYQELHYSPK